jgi:hypothetical protein
MIIRNGKVLMSALQFEELPDYSCSLPTGTRIGKRWRRREPYIIQSGTMFTYWLGEYVHSSDPETVGIEWRQIVLPDGYLPKELSRTGLIWLGVNS